MVNLKDWYKSYKKQKKYEKAVYKATVDMAKKMKYPKPKKQRRK